MLRLKNLRYSLATALVLGLAAGAFSGAQFYVKWGCECGYGQRYNRSSQTFGFPAPAIKANSIYDRAEVDPFKKNSVSYSVEADGLVLNILALAAVLIFVGRLSEKILARFKPAAIPVESPRVKVRQRILFRRA